MEKLQKRLSEIGGSISPTTLSEFERNNTLPTWINYSAVSKYKSIRRAIRRGNLDLLSGVSYPRRPFNNRKPTRGRKFNELRKTIYGQLMHRTELSI